MHLSFGEIASHQWLFDDDIDIDAKLFFSQPTSDFVIDNRIPAKVRELICEAENSRKSNYLVGASACIRKAIYELLECEQTIVKNPKTGYADYQQSIKKLKQKFSNVESDFFKALKDIQEMAGNQVHEGSWKAWDSKKLRFIIELIKTTLHEIYVIPEERKKKLNILSKMKSDFSDSKK